MRNKNTFIALLVIFAAICVYNLAMTVWQFQLSGKMEAARKAAVAAEIKPVKTKQDSAAITAYQKLMADRDLQDNYDMTVRNSFTLGLDLQGGMFVTLEVGVDEVIRQMAGSAADSTFNKVMTLAIAKQNSGEQKPFVTLFDETFQEVAPNAKLGTYFASPKLGISFDSDRSKVLGVLQKEADAAVDQTFQIVRTRIDQFGVVSPNLQKQPGTGRILLELPGVKDPERVRKLLRSTAKLEFWETYTVAEAYPVLQKVNEAMRTGVVTDTTKKDTAKDVAAVKKDTAKTGQSVAAALGDSAKDDNLSKDQQREKFIKENPLWAMLQFPDPKTIDANSPVVGYAAANDTAKISAALKKDDFKSIIPDDMRFSWSFKPIEKTDVFTLVALKSNLEGKASLSATNNEGEDFITSARMNFDAQGRAIVDMSMSSGAAADWADITGNNIKKSVAIVLDGYVYSFPTVQGKIAGGNSQISGNFTIDEAKDLANILKAGQFSAPARIQGEDVVGPSLGEQNVGNGLMSFIAALLVTFVFMFLYYRGAGMIANVALIVNMLFLLGMSAAFNIVQTLPGIGAIVLTIGMAVDANVLIYERVREELAEGKTMKAAIKAGFSNAFSSIVDANVTTFLTGAVLFAFGIGPIKGFAVSLMIGIITTLITGLLVTRLILEYYADRPGANISFGSKQTIDLFKGLKLNFLAVKKRWYIISGVSVGISLLAIAIFGFKLGVDFNGGRQITYSFAKGGAAYKLENNVIEKVRSELTAAFKGEAPVIKTLSSDNQLQITTSYKAADNAATDEVISIMKASFGKTLPGVSATQLSLANVGPAIAADIKWAAFQSVIGSLIMIFVYVLIRFRKWQYSLGGIAALFHDVIVTMGIFSILGAVGFQWFDIEMNQALIAALLTIIGFSINDTVVIFDRIRENINEHHGVALPKLFDKSIDETISRTIMTSLTVFLTTVVLFIFGGESIRGFVFAFMIGVIVGTYSSIFVASAIALDTTSPEDQENRPVVTKKA